MTAILRIQRSNDGGASRSRVATKTTAGSSVGRQSTSQTRTGKHSMHAPIASPPSAAATARFHDPPKGVEYNDNDTVFGKILKGESPAQTIDETRNLLSFHDINPRAPLHALVIPKRLVDSVLSIGVRDLDLVQEMKETAMRILHKEQPEAAARDDYILCFHVPPFNSVDHLHLHVLAPASKMSFYSRLVRYNGWTRWCTSLDRVISRLRAGQPSVSGRRKKRTHQASDASIGTQPESASDEV